MWPKLNNQEDFTIIHLPGQIGLKIGQWVDHNDNRPNGVCKDSKLMSFCYF